MTPGTMLFVTGIGVVGLAAILSLALLFTRKSSKRKIDAKMKERY